MTINEVLKLQQKPMKHFDKKNNQKAQTKPKVIHKPLNLPKKRLNQQKQKQTRAKPFVLKKEKNPKRKNPYSEIVRELYEDRR